MGLAQNTVDAYGRGLEEFLGFLRSVGAPFLQVTREHVAGYVRFLQAQPGQVDHEVVAIDSTSRLSNATLQQRITVVRLFYDFLHEEQQTDWNPVGRGRYRPGTAFGVGTQRGLTRAHESYRGSLMNWLGTGSLISSPRSRYGHD